ncbi:TatD family hydrolase [Candidatus Peregrinibacteria bacterium]|nr:TatD family hydrolase [Candidatus Peregrinibacteria bacterium]
MHLIDTHCHLNFDKFDIDLDDVVKRAKAAGVTKMISIGCRVEDARKTIPILEKYEGVYGSLGIHPSDTKETFEDDFQTIRELASHPKVVAIGETGIDLYRPENPPLQRQVSAFEIHFEFAKKMHRPVIVHSRSAVNETLEVLQKHKGYPFVVHCFSEGMEVARKILDLNGMISFTGVVTFGKNDFLLEVVRTIPLDRIMVETDAPFLAPPPNRGKRCEPAFVRDTAEFIAKIRGISLEEFSEATTKNAEKFFGI